MTQRLSQEDYEYIYQKVPRLCVDLLVKDDQGRILLTRRDISPHLGAWHLPGGAVRFGETLAEAANRLAQAELGTSVTVLGSKGYVEFMEERLGAAKLHSVAIVLEATLAGEPEAREGSDALDYFDLETLPEPGIPEQRAFFKGLKI